MKQSLHYQKILKRVVARLWDTLSIREQAIVAGDTEGETPVAKWFNSTVLAEAKAKYESPTYWMNDPESFKNSPRVDRLSA
jgi:hypothetical protein